jgi:hypothetical protein
VSKKRGGCSAPKKYNKTNDKYVPYPSHMKAVYRV